MDAQSRFLRFGIAIAVLGSLIGLLSPAVLAQMPPDQVGPDPIAGELSTEDQGDGQAGDETKDILDMDIEQLGRVDVAPSLQMEVSTVERQVSTVGKTPAAVFVITNEMIRRSGVRNIADALRLAPGVEVMQTDASYWAISIRGFNNYFARKLLVQFDGRTVYSPSFGGVNWNWQQYPLEDIERIEVIRGPGGTIWGANAVNGVINILTKSSQDTQGGLYEGGAGTFERGFNTIRYGGRFGRDGTYRIYGMWFERGGSEMHGYTEEDLDRQGRAGFRADWKAGPSDTMTLQGDYGNDYANFQELYPYSFPPNFYQNRTSRQHDSDANILYRWTKTISDESDWAFQCYYDNTNIHLMNQFYEYSTDILDLDFQYRFPLELGRRHDIICGCGYRDTKMRIEGDPFYRTCIPPERRDNLFSYFVQDQITLEEDRWFFVVGSKFEHNDYTGFEFQPTARLLWTPDQRHCIWAAISRAVQVPTFAERSIYWPQTPAAILYPPDVPVEMPVFPTLTGNPEFGSEDVLAYEAGIRVQPTEKFYWDLAVFFNKYESVTSLLPGAYESGVTPGDWPALYAPLYPVNDANAETYGFELTAGYTINERWRLRGTYSFLRMTTHELDDTLAYCLEGVNPRNQFNLWLSGDLGNDWNVDIIGRYVDNLPALDVPSYCVADVRLAWRPRDNFELFVVGRNLFKQSHPEWTSTETVTSTTYWYGVPQEVYGGVTWKF